MSAKSLDTQSAQKPLQRRLGAAPSYSVCPFWVQSAILTVQQSLPVCPDKQTISEPRHFSCDHRTHSPHQTAATTITSSARGEWDQARPAPLWRTRLKAKGDEILKIGRKLGIGTSVV
jgi:hypothetical protein